LGQAVGQVFLQHIGRNQGSGKALARSMYGVWSGLALIGIVPFGLIAFFGPVIFEFAFGDEWKEAGIIAQLLTPLMFVRFICSPTSSIYLKLKLTRAQFWFVIAAVCYRSAAYSIALISDSIEIMIIVHVILEILGIIAYNFWALRKLHALGKEIAP
jgi:O-antigen/teichoic acid export membrane protein